MSSLAELKPELLRLSAATDAGFAAKDDSPVVARIIALAAQVEALNPTPRPVDQPRLLDGRWKLLYSSFGLERQTTLRRISFATLPREARIAVDGVYQMVDAATGRYDNHVEFRAENGTAGVHVTRGIFKPQDGSDKRLEISFVGNGAYPLAAESGPGDLRAALGLGADEPLEAPVKFDGWSDVTYLDDDTRLMRGNAGNLYVLEKIAAVAGPDPRTRQRGISDA